MYVIKRNGNKESVNFDKVHKRITYLVNEPYALSNINAAELTILVIQGLINNIKTSDIDIYTASLSSALATKHRNYLVLAGRVSIDNHHKNTLNSFSDKISLLYSHKDNLGKSSPIISHIFNKFVNINKVEIDSCIDYSKDYLFDYFGFKTLEKGYLLSINEEVIERPQDMFMRVAINIYMPTDLSQFRKKDCLVKIFHTYKKMSDHYYTHATPTLFNSGSNNANLSSCFLLGSNDSIGGIMKSLTDSVNISKWSGGVGLHISMWRALGSVIRGTNGKSNGVVPFLRMFNDGARAFNQGGKRNGSFAIYIEPHHPDIMRFLNLRLTHGDENERCRDLFTALWISDLFMERVKANKKWSTFCPDRCPGLNMVYGEEFKKLYLEYETKGMQTETFNAMDIWFAIYESHKQSGLPYMCYKDNVNLSNMQENIGIINSSNLCTEIVQHSSSTETAVCNLSSICLPIFVEDIWSKADMLLPESERRVLDHEFPINAKMNYKKLAEIASDIAENLNKVIDVTFNPVIESARSNFKHRPFAIGIQGLADVFLKFGVAFESPEAAEINKNISEAIYYGALSKSTELCRLAYLNIIKTFNPEIGYSKTIFPKHVLKHYPTLIEENTINHYNKCEDIPKTIGAYSSYMTNGGSPLFNGKFHWELYNVPKENLSGLFDWDTLKSHIEIYGVMNSLTTAYMPTGTTSQIMGCSPCFEPYVSNIYKRTTLAGSYTIVNKYLVKYLQDNNLYDEKFNSYMLANNGSIQNISGIPDKIKLLYKTAWEIKQKAIVQLAIDRQPFIDQSQSMNVFFEIYSKDAFTSIQFYGWKNKLKTGSYYVRTREAVMPDKFTISPEIQREIELSELIKLEITGNDVNDETICLMCSS